MSEARTLEYYYVDEECDYDAPYRGEVVLHIPEAMLGAPLIGPNHDAVLDGVTVEELAVVGFGSEINELDTEVADDVRDTVRAILSRLSVKVPRATIRARVKIVDCPECRGTGKFLEGQPPEIDEYDCPACLGVGKLLTLTVNEDVPLPAKDGEWVELALLAEEE